MSFKYGDYAIVKRFRSCQRKRFTLLNISPKAKKKGIVVFCIALRLAINSGSITTAPKARCHGVYPASVKPNIHGMKIMI